MAITFKGERRTALQKNNNNVSTTSRIFLYHFDTWTSGVQISQQSELPLIGEEHPNDSSLICTGINTGEPDPNDKPSGKFLAIASYTNQQNSFSIGSQAIRPWQLPPYNISYPPFESTIVFEKSYQSGDKNGIPSLPVLNSAGDPIADVTNENSWMIKFSYNLKTVNGNWMDFFLDTVNNQDITIVGFNVPSGKGRLKQMQPSFHRTFDAQGELLYKYWQIDIEIEVRKQKWQKELLDQGLNILDAEKKYRIYTDGKGVFGKRSDMLASADDPDDVVAVDEPMKLDGSGALLDQALQTAEYLEPKFDKFFTNWNPLSFPRTVDG